MRQKGVITRWEDERGFGFITPIAEGSSVFVHASECPPGAHPVPGQVVTFHADRDDRNRLRASDVQYVGLSHRRTQIARGLPGASVVAVVFFGLLGVLAVLGLLPGVAVALSVLSSVAAFVLYRTDKAAATRGAWRVSESTLHVVSLLGGWPGALIAQRVYHHKTRKQPFQTVFRITVVVNCAALAYVAIGQPIQL